MLRTLSQGSSGPDVRALQDVLNYHIRRQAPLKVDGIFGPATGARVKVFQVANGLMADGVVGPKTAGRLYQVQDVVVPLFIMPKLQLTLPPLGQPAPGGIQPPRLIPQLQWPTPTVPPIGPFRMGGSFLMRPNGLSLLPDLSAPVNALSLRVTVPVRQDPVDPDVRSRNAILQLIDDMPVDSKFKVLLADQVPQPVSRISPPGSGFSWGVDPVFNPFNPTGFGAKGNARYTVRVSDGRNGRPNIVFGGWGDLQLFLNFESRQGQALPRLEAQGQVFLGFEGTF